MNPPSSPWKHVPVPTTGAGALYDLGVFIAGYRFNGNDDDFYLMKLENDNESYSSGKPNLMFSNSFEN